MAGTVAGAAKRKLKQKRKPAKRATTRLSAKAGMTKRKTPAKRAKR